MAAERSFCCKEYLRGRTSTKRAVAFDEFPELAGNETYSPTSTPAWTITVVKLLFKIASDFFIVVFLFFLSFSEKTSRAYNQYLNFQAKGNRNSLPISNIQYISKIDNYPSRIFEKI